MARHAGVSGWRRRLAIIAGAIATFVAIVGIGFVATRPPRTLTEPVDNDADAPELEVVDE